MSKEKVYTMTCKELLEVAREKQIVGRHKMTKAKLIEAILGAEDAAGAVSNDSSATDECKVDNHKNVEAANKNEKKTADVPIDMKQKMHYIEKAEIGSLVAFRLSNGKVKSAKIINKSTKNRKLKLETEYNAVYIVSYDDIIWVRTGLRWPRGVYKLLKGIGDGCGERQEVKA